MQGLSVVGTAFFCKSDTSYSWKSNATIFYDVNLNFALRRASGVGSGRALGARRNYRNTAVFAGNSRVSACSVLADRSSRRNVEQKLAQRPKIGRRRSLDEGKRLRRGRRSVESDRGTKANACVEARDR